jgi:hypothetical protein
VQAGVNFNVADVATLTAAVGYGEGLIDQKFGNGFFTPIDVNGDPLEVLSFMVGVSFGLSETTTFNAMFSHTEALDDQFQIGADQYIADEVYKVNANIMWQPVRQMRMGWEVVWGHVWTAPCWQGVFLASDA